MATLSPMYTALTLWQIQCRSQERRAQPGHKCLFLVDKGFNSITLRAQQPGGSPKDLKTNYLSPTSVKGVFSMCCKYFMSWHGKQSLFSNISSEEVARRETKGNFFLQLIAGSLYNAWNVPETQRPTVLPISITVTSRAPYQDQGSIVQGLS